MFSCVLPTKQKVWNYQWDCALQSNSDKIVFGHHHSVAVIQWIFLWHFRMHTLDWKWTCGLLNKTLTEVKKTLAIIGYYGLLCWQMQKTYECLVDQYFCKTCHICQLKQSQSCTPWAWWILKLYRSLHVSLVQSSCIMTNNE